MTVVVTGAGGQLGSVVLGRLVRAGRRAVGFASLEGPLPAVGDTVRLDLTDESAVESALLRVGPSAVVHTAAISSVAASHADPERARRVNAVATAELARASTRQRARFVHVSTDMVFDGERAPYGESAEPGPLSAYGASKLEGERLVREIAGTLVVRLPLLYGVPGVARETTFRAQMRALRDGRPLDLFHDEFRTPLSLEDASEALLRCVDSDVTGILHAGGPERLSRLAMGTLLAEALGVKDPVIRATSRLEVTAPEPRARDLSLDSSRFEREFGVRAGRPMREALATLAFSG